MNDAPRLAHMDGRQRPRGALDEEVAAVVLPPVLVWDVNMPANDSLTVRVTEGAELDAPFSERRTPACARSLVETALPEKFVHRQAR